MKMLPNNLPAVLHDLLVHQYENGFKQVTDIDVLLEKILAAIEKELDIQPKIS